MTEILEYIMLHYTWFLGGAILILLAIIGSYADKTNFGQGKNIEENTEEKINLEKKGLEDYVKESVEINIDENKLTEQIDINTSISSLEKQNNNEVLKNIQNNKKDEQLEQPTNIVEPKEEVPEHKKQSFEENFNNFDKEFNSILSKKQTISDDLLNDVENISLDNLETLNKSTINAIPDLDDVELPKIKTVEKNIVDVWKF